MKKEVSRSSFCEALRSNMVKSQYLTSPTDFPLCGGYAEILEEWDGPLHEYDE